MHLLKLIEDMLVILADFRDAHKLLVQWHSAVSLM